jgi:hypothetical protein
MIRVCTIKQASELCVPAAPTAAPQEARNRDVTELELRYSNLAAKLVKSRQAVANRDGQIAQLQQALAAAHMALLDAGLDCQQVVSVDPSAAAAAAAAAAAQQQQAAAAYYAAPSGSNNMAAAGLGKDVEAANVGSGGSSGRASAADDLDVMSVALSCEASVSSCCSSRMTGASSTSTVWGVNAAAAASWTAAMEVRERERQVQRLVAACGDKQAKVKWQI